MELAEFISLLNNIDELRAKISVTQRVEELALFRDQYNTKKHKVMNASIRKKKEVVTKVQGMDTTEWKEVARIPAPYQKLIVSRAATFLCGKPVKLECTPESETDKALLTIVAKMWRDAKLGYESKTLAKKLFSECECAELWYWDDATPEYWRNTVNASRPILREGATVEEPVANRLRVRILAPSLGDTLYPVWADSGDMIAFCRAYTRKQSGTADAQHFDVYTADEIRFYQRTDLSGGWILTQAIPNAFGKIPVIYYSQEYPEWWDVQEAIERLEALQSNLADTNDYNGSPIILVKGTIKGFSEKGESGKVLQLEGDAKAEYLTWQNAPESIKLEMENLIRQIHDHTDTPNISFEQMKGLGQPSGVAFKFFFMAAHMKASDHAENVGKGFQRRLNLLKAAAIRFNAGLGASSELEINPEFEYYLPDDHVERITMLNAAVNGGHLSIESAVEQSPLVQDPKTELVRLKKESDERAAREQQSLIPL